MSGMRSSTCSVRLLNSFLLRLLEATYIIMAVFTVPEMSKIRDKYRLSRTEFHGIMKDIEETLWKKLMIKGEINLLNMASCTTESKATLHVAFFCSLKYFNLYVRYNEKVNCKIYVCFIDVYIYIYNIHIHVHSTTL